MSLIQIQDKTANSNQQCTLHEALRNLDGDTPSIIPLLVRLLENPASPIALPGKIDLYGHDCLHVLLKRGFSLYDEAFVVGFTMGNDVRTNWIHLVIFKFCSSLLYPKAYRFNQLHLEVFNLGFSYGRSITIKNLNQVDFSLYRKLSIEALRNRFGIDLKPLQSLQKA
jgi:hypothetical protein